MTLTEKLYLLEELLDIEEGTLKEDTELSQLTQWDSMALIVIIAMFDENFGRHVTPEVVKNFKTVKDIINQME